MDGIEISVDIVTIDIARVNRAIVEYNASSGHQVPQIAVNQSFQDFVQGLHMYHREVVVNSKSFLDTVLKS